MALIKCPECEQNVSETATNCPHCGYTLGRKKFCKFCGQKIDIDCIICPICGKRVEGGVDDRQVIINNSASSSAVSSLLLSLLPMQENYLGT